MKTNSVTNSTIAALIAAVMSGAMTLPSLAQVGTTTPLTLGTNSSTTYDEAITGTGGLTLNNYTIQINVGYDPQPNWFSSTPVQYFASGVELGSITSLSGIESQIGGFIFFTNPAINIVSNNGSTLRGEMSAYADFTKFVAFSLTQEDGDMTNPIMLTVDNAYYAEGVYTGQLISTVPNLITNTGAYGVDSLSAGSANVLDAAGSITTTLTENNTYTGDTTINGGRLNVSGRLGGGNYAGQIINKTGLELSNADSQLLSGVISGEGSFVMSGAGSTTLSGSNTYAGGTTLSDGTLRAGHDSAFGSGGLTLNGGTLASDSSAGRTLSNNMTIGGAVQFGDATGSGDLTFAGTIGLGGGNRSITTEARTTLAAAVSNGALTKLGADTLVLGANNSYAGGTTISAGALQVGNGGTTGSLGTGAVTNNASLIFDRSNTATVGNVISGTGTVTQQGTGTTEFTANNTYSGGLVVTGGQAMGNSAAAFGTGGITLESGTLMISREESNITLTNPITVTAGGAGGATIAGATTERVMFYSGDVTLDGDAMLSAANTVSRTTFSGGMSGAGGVTVTGGRVTFEATSKTYTGGTTVNADAVLQLSGNEMLSDAQGVTVNGALYFASGGGMETIGSLSGAGTVQSHPGVGGNYDLVISHADTATFDGTIANGLGTVALTKAGSGTQVLSGNNTYTGFTLVNDGRLILSGNYASPNFTIASGSVLEHRIASGTLDGPSATYSGVGTLVKAGAGTLLWGVSNAAFALETGSLIDVQEGTFTGGSSANENWSNNRSSLNVAAGAIFAGAEANVRVDALTGAGTISSGLTEDTSYINFTFGVADGSGTFSGILADGGSVGHFVKAGSGTQVLSGNNTYTGTTTISAGTLEVGDGGTSGSLGTGEVVNNGTLSFNRSDAFTVSNDISGSGDLIQQGSGTLSLSSGANYLGLTQIESGTLALLSEASIENSSEIRIDNGARFDVSAQAGIYALLAAQTLSGGGTVEGAIAIEGTHTPGFSPGLQSFEDGLSYASGASFVWELTDNSSATSDRGVNFDAVDVSGAALNFAAGLSADLVFDLDESNVAWSDAFWDNEQSWLVFGSIVGTAATDAAIFDTVNLSADSTGAELGSVVGRENAFFQWRQDGNDIYLDYSPVPEPASYAALFGLLALGWASAARRRCR